MPQTDHQDAPPASLFPSAREADADGLVFVSADMPKRAVLSAYLDGIFPWPAGDGLIGWFSPDPRYVLRPAGLHFNRSMRRALKRLDATVTCDTAFERVLDACASMERRDQEGTWITSLVRRVFLELHRDGLAHSVEAWSEGRLVGGLYGLHLGKVFFGESMFHERTGASRACIAALCESADILGIDLIDCQVRTEHMLHIGAEPMPREHFLHIVERIPRSLGKQPTWHPGTLEKR